MNNSINCTFKIRKNNIRIKKDVPSNYGYTLNDLNRICVYSHVYNNENKPFYIGQGSIQRAFNFTNRNKSWHNKAIDVSKVKVNILHIDISIEESIKIETELIKQYGRLDDNTGCLVNGNDGDTSIGQKGELNYFFNKHFYKEQNSNYGNKYNKNPNSIPVIQIDILGNIVKEWSSATEASEIGGFHAGCIAKCCNKERRLHKMYQWIYKSDYSKLQDYRYKPGYTSSRIYICYNIYGNYVKTYYNNNELITDGFKPKNVNQVAHGQKHTHLGYIFKDFFNMNNIDKKRLIDDGCINIRD